VDHAPVQIFGEISCAQKAADSMCRTVVTVQRKVVTWLEEKNFFVFMSSNGRTICVFVLGIIDLSIAALSR
jgi:hypothetical protein